jgi:hypothetical protein
MKKEPFKHLIPGKHYKIIKTFKDYDGKPYQPGKIYTYLGNDFLPYDDGLTLHFSQSGEVVAVRLQWREEAQKEIIEGLEHYFVTTNP